jgi:hypothetical protein
VRLLGDLVSVAGSRKADADVEELADAQVPGQVVDHAGEKGAAGAGGVPGVRRGFEYGVADDAVSGEVVFT